MKLFIRLLVFLAPVSLAGEGIYETVLETCIEFQQIDEARVYARDFDGSDPWKYDLASRTREKVLVIAKIAEGKSFSKEFIRIRLNSIQSFEANSRNRVWSQVQQYVESQAFYRCREE